MQAVAAAAEMCPGGQPTRHTESASDQSQQTMKRNGTFWTGIFKYRMLPLSQWNLDEKLDSQRRDEYQVQSLMQLLPFSKRKT